MTPEGIELAKQVSKYIRGCDVIDGANVIDALLAEVARLQLEMSLQKSQIVEKCAVTAWNHYMDTCLKSKLAPAEHNKWNATRSIRSIQSQELLETEDQHAARPRE